MALAIQATESAELCAIASRSMERAEQFSRDYGISSCYGRYEDLLDDDSIDAVYIPLPPAMHAEWTIRAAERKKHVLCEKPIAVTVAQALDMASACRENSVQLLDGTMWVHHPRAHDMYRFLRDGTLGELRRITTAFGLPIDAYLRDNPPATASTAAPDTRDDPADSTLSLARACEFRLNPTLGGGALLDLGWYCVRAALWGFGCTPKQVFGTALFKDGVTVNFTAIMWFPGERIATFDCGFDRSWRKWFEVVGSEGSLTCDDLVSPHRSRPTFTLHETRNDAGEQESEPLNQVECLVEAFCDSVLSGSLNDSWPEIAIENQRVCDALLKSAKSGQVILLG